MNRLFISSVVAVALCAAGSQAQVTESTTRVERQHKNLHRMEKKLDQIQAQLIDVLRTGTPVVQAQAIQTIRELEQMFPTYSFDSMLLPLTKKLRDDNADSVVRLLAALALDELHSDAGDAAVRDVAESSHEEGVRKLCEALLVRSDYQ